MSQALSLSRSSLSLPWESTTLVGWHITLQQGGEKPMADINKTKPTLDIIALYDSVQCSAQTYQKMPDELNG